MTDVSILSYDHKTIVGTRVMQIALSRAYGDGADLACLLASDAVTDLLGGLPVNGYASLNYGVLGILNDAVGGVTVTLDEDMTISGKEYKSGDAVTLEGDMTADYIRSRTGRRERHERGAHGRAGGLHQGLHRPLPLLRQEPCEAGLGSVSRRRRLHGHKPDQETRSFIWVRRCSPAVGRSRSSQCRAS